MLHHDSDCSGLDKFARLQLAEMPRVISVQPLDNYRLAVHFDDGVEGVIELQDRLFGPVFEPLRDPAAFEQLAEVAKKAL